MNQMLPLNGTATQFLDCLARSDHHTSPYDFWLLKDALPAEICHGIAALPVAPPTAPTFDGRRESNNSTRFYSSPDAQREHAVCREVAEAFRHPQVISALVARTGSRVDNGLLRIEYCQDTDGFWLEPHLDISVKLFTMLVYLSEDPNLADAGTDVYDASPEHKTVATAPYAFNAGMIFIPGTDTWHGFRKRPIRGLRKSIIINYVKPEWRDRYELA
ncbi:MAG: 2OG-Fe(II) oxygenase [Hyphomicrobiaceae bacterium]